MNKYGGCALRRVDEFLDSARPTVRQFSSSLLSGKTDFPPERARYARADIESAALCRMEIFSIVFQNQLRKTAAKKRAFPSTTRLFRSAITKTARCVENFENNSRRTISNVSFDFTADVDVSFIRRRVNFGFFDRPIILTLRFLTGYRQRRVPP